MGIEGDQKDVLTFADDGGEPVDQPYVGNGNIALHVRDDAKTPGATTLDQLSELIGAPFQSGVDLYLPADPEATITITITNLRVGDSSDPQVIQVPAWLSGDEPLYPPGDSVHNRSREYAEVLPPARMVACPTKPPNC